jgi:hypothetical protein
LLPDFFNEIGQKQTFATQKGMSALSPIADIKACERHVRFVPIADIAFLDHLVGARDQCRRHGETERLCTKGTDR